MIDIFKWPIVADVLKYKHQIFGVQLYFETLLNHDLNHNISDYDLNQTNHDFQV